ncbi:MAG: aminotransferase class I/II-fold pyridoxal phosphate-dependent enzyme, partial [Bacteroidales bacterium]|nr:aminotransferase class I/II-fold pyridoxal phosphate-dependent enzyme [Bacteroidales bacterium]
RTESTVNFKGLNGFIRTIVSGTAETAIDLLTKEVFSKNSVRVLEFSTAEKLYNEIYEDGTSIFAIKMRNMRKNPFNAFRWFPFLTRMVFIDDSPESRSTNTSLIFCLHNGIINTLNKVHTKKLGALANSQLNLRLIHDKVNSRNLKYFRQKIEEKIVEYDKELRQLKEEQLANPDDPDQDIILYKFDEFARQVIKDKYILSKFGAYINLIENTRDTENHKIINREMISEFEERTLAYFYSENKSLHIATVVEGGGRNQIRTYGEYLLERPLKPVKDSIIKRCRTILDIVPDNYQRTIHNHFHKNFGINLFLEKYKEYLTKVENSADNQGRFRNLLIDLGIEEKYNKKDPSGKQIINEFISNLGNLKKTSISDDVQMIIRDLLFYKNRRPNPFIYFNQEAAWEYKDLFPPDRFDLNPFDIEIELTEEGRVDWERLLIKLERIKSTFQLFDETGNLWDRFCENSTLIINDPSNPSGFTDFNNIHLIKFFKFLNNSKLTLFLDEAYNDAVKIEDPEEPKWRTISRYIMNNIGSFARISIVSSLSTTKNLGATGDRLGSLIATPVRKDVIDYAREQFGVEKGNTNSLFILINILETAQLAKKIKDRMDESLPKDASRYKIKDKLKKYIMTEIRDNINVRENGHKDRTRNPSLFEGSPLHLFLLEELISLDKLDVLELPDDFKYKGVPFFSYYKEHLVQELNEFRVNKIFRKEANKRLDLAREKALSVLSENEENQIGILDSDGSYLFNLHLKDFFSYQDLEKFTKKLADQRGIALIPYQTGFLRFSLGDYLEGTADSYDIYIKEFENALRIFLKYWSIFHEAKNNPSNKTKRTEDILDEIFSVRNDSELIRNILEDFYIICDLDKKINNSLKISDIKTLYHAFPKECGVSINSIGDSKNAVLEFYENVGKCRNLTEFILSKAFTKIYENLLPQVYRNIPHLKKLDINTVIAKYGKTTLLKYIKSKLEFQPDRYILDNPDELTIMQEILLELEKILFSDAKTKILSIKANENDISGDLAKLEGYNRILRKYIQELLLHFNLPFEQQAIEPTFEQLANSTALKFNEIVGLSVNDLNTDIFMNLYIEKIDNRLHDLNQDEMIRKYPGVIQQTISKQIHHSHHTMVNKILFLYLLQKDSCFETRVIEKISRFTGHFDNTEPEDIKLIKEDLVSRLIPAEITTLMDEIFIQRNVKIMPEQLHDEVREMVLFFISLANMTKNNEYYKKYNHILIRLVETEFMQQNSSVNEMVQHGIVLHRDFSIKSNTLEKWDKGSLSWIAQLMSRCGVIAWEQPVQTHTRIATDAKKREYPYYKVDRIEDPSVNKKIADNPNRNEFIKKMQVRPLSSFFTKRLALFAQNLDEEDYRCKIVNTGLVKELHIIQKSFLKYLTDNYRLIGPGFFKLNEVQEFVPDIILLLGAPEKVISFPQIGYFDLKGPNGNIKTIVTPLKKSADYFGNIKKPRLTMVNEKVKELGGIPVHGSLFAVEEDDGSIFVIQVSGDSGVGKSEMLAAMMLKWMKKDLPGIRSIKMIAGDMFHLFPDEEGNLYGIGTETGDFSRVTDFDPDFIKYYNSLFESSADSNVNDLNSRSTISGLCDINMPIKIDIMLTAYNFAKEEAGLKRYANPENFFLYRDSHGERKEKATSSDNPHIQRTLLRYTGDRNIVEIIDQHGNYLDDVLSWEKDEYTGVFYLSSSYKMMDKIDIEDIVNKIFIKKYFNRNDKEFLINKVRFDIIENRFIIDAKCTDGDSKISFPIDRDFFGTLFKTLASTPAGNPFIAEPGESESKKHLIEILKGKPDGKGKGKNIQLGILSTDLGKKGKEITGPQKAAADVRTLIREVRIMHPDLDRKKNHVKSLIIECYKHLFKHHKHNMEIWRYNFYLYQLDEMRKARLVRVDDMKTKIDLSGLAGFYPLPKNHKFSPLLITPNINIELNGFSETYEQLMWLPNNQEFANQFYLDCEKVYVAKGYSKDTIINNMVIQLLLMNGYIAVEDLTRGRITEKANRETIAAAKFTAVRKLKEIESKKTGKK